MYPDQDRAEAATKAEPQSLMEAQAIHQLLTRLEDKLRPVLRPSGLEKATATPETVKSELMQELGYFQNRLNDLLGRLHV